MAYAAPSRAPSAKVAGEPIQRLQDESMSTAMDQEPIKVDASAGRLLRFTVRVVAAALVVTGLVAWLLVSHTPTSTSRAAPRASAGDSSGLFYHASHQMSYRRSGDGLYHIDAEINERKIPFVVDAGNASVILSPDDARAAGIGNEQLHFGERAVTPAGEMPVAPVIIPMMTINQLTLFNVKGVVTESPLSTSVVGKDFLKRFDSYDMRREELVLRW
jgi:clan AA aspartic protease (TIGR02281 family)